MLPSIEQLLILQDRDQKIRDLTIALQQLPEEKISLENEWKKSESKLEVLKTEQRVLDLDLKKLEGEVLVQREKINRYRTQQQTTRKNDEYAAFNHEIAATEKTISVLEERELALMEQGEAMKPQLRAAEESITIERERFENLLEGLKKRHEQLIARRDELISDRPRFLTEIDEDLLHRYDRLFKSKQGLAVVPVEHGICTGCHMKLTMQTVLSTKAAREIIDCAQCGRFLYCDEE